MFCLLLFFASPAHATNSNAEAAELSARTTLAYVVTGDRDTDRISELGLNGLALMLERRTSIDHVAVAGINPNSDDLAFYPFLYWPLTLSQQPLSPQGVARVNDYLHHGGMILFDTETGEAAPPGLIQRLLAGVDIPPLQRMPEDHVLKKSFYLLDTFPGRYADGDFWVETDDTPRYDNVATILAGTNGYAAAWAVDNNGKPLFPCTPGGEVQREYAYRFGVNLAMYALTGNYKSDQMHAQALMQRMGK